VNKWVFPALIRFSNKELNLPDHYLIFFVPGALRDYASTIVPKNYYCLTATKPHKPRTTGPNSQSHHFHGHCRQIAEYTGHEVDEIKMELKRRAMKRGYPALTDELGNPIHSRLDGRVLPLSEADADTTQESYLIEEAHALAADLSIRLIEE
jgi:hypothetical protein